MAAKSSKRVLKKCNPATKLLQQDASKLAVLEVKVERIEALMAKLDTNVDEIKHNHLQHIALSLNTIEAQLVSVSTYADNLKKIELKLNSQDARLEAINSLRKLVIAIAVILAPTSIVMVIEAVKHSLGH